MLWFLVRINDQSVGTFTARRQQEIDLRSPSVADEVCDYVINIDGSYIGKVQHRYGDGKWALIKAGIELLEGKQ